MDINNELEEMRSQIALLKEKLDNEKIVNDKILRNATKTKIRSLRINQIIEYVSALFVITFGSVVFRSLGCSWEFVITTIIYMLFCAIMTFIQHRQLNRADVTNGDLLTVAKYAKKLKKDYHNWLYFAIPSIILWFSWLLNELYTSGKDEHMILASGIGVLIGGTIGFLIGWMMNRKAKHTLDDIVRLIEE